MTEFSFTVDEILSAAEKNKYKNGNDMYIGYESNDYTYPVEIEDAPDPKDRKIVFACVIGEAFLNLGFTENGLAARDLSSALQYVKPDEGVVTIPYTYEMYGKRYAAEDTFDDLAEFINILNGYNGYKGKKRIVALARKHFSKSLNQVITIGD